MTNASDTLTDVATGPQQAMANRLVYVARVGRGRLGGSGLLLQMAQRAMAQGRAIRLLDGDLKSQTLAKYYPPRRQEDGGEDVPRLCVSPPSDDAVDFRDWILDDLSALAEDKVSRGLDVSGGDRSLQDLMCDLELPSFCRDEGVSFLWLCMLGPDEEDLSHVSSAVDRGQMSPEDMLLVMNEGAIRSGQNPAGAFEAIKSRPDFEAMALAGAKVLYLPRLPCMDKLRSNRLDFYQIAEGGPGPNGKRDAVLTHITKRWLGDIEGRYAKLRLTERLP